MGKCSRRGVLGALAVLGVPAPALGGGRRTLFIQPLGAGIADADVAFVKRALLAFYGFDVAVLEPLALPKVAFYAPRRRYRAERLLDTLEERLPAGGFRILGLTATDISTTKGNVADWGVLGLATLDGRACVLSSFRCRRGSKGAGHTRERLGKVAVHEIGHTLGLEHCPTRGCLMEDGGGTVTTVDREYDLCATSRQRLAAAGHPLADPSGDLPWGRP